MTDVSSSSAALSPADSGAQSAPAPTAHISDLLHQVAREDRAAFAELYRATAPKLLGTVLRILNQKSWMKVDVKWFAWLISTAGPGPTLQAISINR